MKFKKLLLVIFVLFSAMFATASWYSFIGNLQWDTAAGIPSAVKGLMFWDDDHEAVAYHDSVGIVHLQDDAAQKNLLLNSLGDPEHIINILTSGYTAGNGTTFTTVTTALQGVAGLSTTPADQIHGTQVFKYTTHATPGTSDDDWIAFPIIDVSPLIDTTALTYGYEFRYKYDGDDGDIEVRAICVDDSSLLLGPSDDSVGLLNDVYTARGNINIPKDCNQIKLGIQVVTSLASKVLLFDEIKITSEPSIRANLTVRGSYVASEAQNTMSNRTGEIQFSGAVTEVFKDSFSSLVAVDHSTDPSTYTALKDVTLEISANVQIGAANDLVNIFKDGSVYSYGHAAYANSSISAHTTSVPLKVGEYVTISTGPKNTPSSATIISGTVLANVEITASADAEAVVLASEKRDEWQDAGTWTIGATTTAPGEGTLATDKMWWRRVGDSMEIRLERRATTNGTAGVGDYLYPIPAGYQIDTSKVTAYSTVEGSGIWAADNSVGTFNTSNNTDGGTGAVVVYDSSYVRLFGLTDAGGAGEGVVSDAFFNLNSGAAGYTQIIKFTVPIVGWTGANQYYVIVPTDETETMKGWTSYTPTTQGFGTVPPASINFRYRRIGDSIEVAGNFTGGTPSATEAQVGLPTGLTIASTTARRVGTWHNEAVTSTVWGYNVLGTSGDSFINMAVVSGAADGIADENGNAIVGAGTTMYFNFTVPIQGWVMGTGIVPSGTFAKVRTAYVKELLGSGVAPGNVVAGNQTVSLNTLEGDTEFISLASDQITLQPGKYQVDGYQGFYNVIGDVQVYLYNITDTVDQIPGRATRIVGAMGGEAFVNGMIDITTAKTYDLRVWSSVTNGSLGNAPASGHDIVHAKLKITQILAR